LPRLAGSGVPAWVPLPAPPTKKATVATHQSSFLSSDDSVAFVCEGGQKGRKTGGRAAVPDPCRTDRHPVEHRSVRVPATASRQLLLLVEDSKGTPQLFVSLARPIRKSSLERLRHQPSCMVVWRPGQWDSIGGPRIR